MRVLIVSHYFHPEPIPKTFDLATELTARGHEVAVITGFPHYPSGELYDGWRLKLLMRQRDLPFPVVRTFQYPYHGRSVLGRIANYVSFMLSAPLGALFTPRCDVLYVWHPPLTVGVAAWIIAWWKRVPFVYDVQDIWPESAVLTGMLKDGLLVRLISRLERFVYRRATHLICVTEGAKRNLVSKGVPAEKISVLPHWIDERAFVLEQPDVARADVRRRFGWDDRFVVMFAGNVGLMQKLDTVIEAAVLLRDDEQLQLVIVGDGADRKRLQTLAAEKDVLHRLQFVDRQPASDMPALMAGADALLVHLVKSELSEWVLPSKTFAYLASGRPIIMAMQGAAADLVAEAGAGVIVEPENATALAEAIRHLARCSAEEREAMGLRGQAHLRQSLSREKVLGQYERLLLDTVSEG
jgi:colanic acid biosynthesis glycosyl transferase WcaI